jgi:hypothetical protein
LLNFLAAVITVAKWLRRPAQIPVRLVRGIRRIIASPEPLSIQLANALDGLAYELAYLVNASDPVRFPRLFIALTVPLTTWLQRPAAGLDSYRRHRRTWREYEAAGLI